MVMKKNHQKHAAHHMEQAAKHHEKAKQHMNMMNEAKEDKPVVTKKIKKSYKSNK